MKIKLIFLIPFLVAFSKSNQAQNRIDTSFAKSILNNDKEFTIGIYGGPNFSDIKAYPGYEHGIGIGYNCSIISRLKMPGKMIFNCGITYERLSYSIQLTTDAYIFGNMDNHVLCLNSYYVSIPLTIGYTSGKGKWSIDASLGIEFYCNFQNKAIVNDVTNGTIIKQQTFYYAKTPVASNWPYSIPSTFNPNWYTLSVFGLFSTCVHYKISSFLSAAFMSSFRFSSPFNSIPEEEPFIVSKGQGSLSLCLGLNYQFKVQDIGGSFLPKDKDVYKIAIGFSVIPGFTFTSYNQPTLMGVHKTFSYSYAFPVQFDISKNLALESGLIMDNFSNNSGYSTTVLIGIPINAKFYFSNNKTKNYSYYLGLGGHIDYPIHDGTGGLSAQSFILPLGLTELGYEARLGNNYLFNMSIGYEHEFPYFKLSESVGDSPQFSQLPRTIFVSIGFSYKFK